MGYGMSRLEEAYTEHEGQSSDGSSSVEVKNEFSKLHNDIFHMTRLRSGPSESIRRSMDAVSITRLLCGRECNSSGNGRFSSVDRAFVLGHYLPVDGPEIVDRMDSRAYVSQFSADGSLFVAGFQVSYAPTNNF
jgi:WD repeat-containing protein 23